MLVLGSYLGILHNNPHLLSHLVSSHRCKPEVESRTQGSRPRPRTQKKIQDQGQPFRGQTLSRPRTGMLEAKDQGHSCKCTPKKKNVVKRSFSGNLQFIGVARTFDWGGLNHKSHAMTSSKICLFALNQDFANGEGLN